MEEAKNPMGRKKWKRAGSIGLCCFFLLLVCGCLIYFNVGIKADSATGAENASYEVFNTNEIYSDSVTILEKDMESEDATDMKTAAEAPALGTISMEAPSDPYLVDEDGSNVAYNASKKVDSGNNFYLGKWNPAVTYTPNESLTNNMELFTYTAMEQSYYWYYDETEYVYTARLQENSGTMDSQYCKTYYWIGAKQSASELYSGFISYVLGKLSYGTYYGSFRYQMDSSGLYGIAQGIGYNPDTSYAEYMLNIWLDDYMSQMGGKVYDANTGISFDDTYDGTSTVLSFLRVGVIRLNFNYLMYRASQGLDDTAVAYNWIGNSMPAVVFSSAPFTLDFYQPLGTPKVQLETGTAVKSGDTKNSVYQDESISLDYPDGAGADTAELEYCLYSSNYSIEDVENRSGWSKVEAGDAISLKGINMEGTNRYLYIRAVVPKNSTQQNYKDGDVVKYSFSLDKSKAGGTISASVKAGTEKVDVGDQVSLVNTNTNAMTLYSTDSSVPSFTKFSGSESLTLSQLNGLAETAQVYFTTEFSDYNYLKLNGFWYQCAKSVLKYSAEEPIEVGTKVREDSRLTIRALSVQNGYEIGSSQKLVLGFELKNTTAAPATDVATTSDAPTEIAMGSSINFSCTTPESEIFYTTNGSKPVITVKTAADGTKSIQSGNSATKKYDEDTGIKLTEDIASYGSNLVFMAKAVYYENGYRVYADSDVVKFVYYVSAQAQTEGVLAIPTTDSSSPATVKAGDKIMLYCNTSGTLIYYTTDGTEPVVNDDGTLGSNTSRYNSSKGIAVPEPTDTLFTITAIAAADGLANSDITRLVYKYAAAVSVPYASPSSGTVSENTSVSLKTSTADAVIYYEIAYDGDIPEEPTTSSSVFDAANPIVITRQSVIKAIAVSDGSTSQVGTFSYTVSDRVSTPVPSLENGSVVPRGTTLTLSSNTGATIYYTTDASNPADAANTNVSIGNTILLEGDAGSQITIRTYAKKADYSDSGVGTYSYTISNYSEGIYANVESGSTIKNGEQITLNTDVSAAEIYYTTDGTVPTTGSTKGNTVLLTGESGSTVTLRAIAVVSGSAGSTASASFTYTIMDKLSAPASSVPSGAVFTKEAVITLSAAAGDIYYTTDGTQPGSGSILYKDGITVNKSMTIRAIAISEDADNSDVSTFAYTFAEQVETPQASAESGQLDMGQEIELTCKTQGASIYYTLDGQEPDLNDMENLTLYTGPVAVNRAVSIKAVAVKKGMQNSEILSVGYTVREPVSVEDTEQLAETENAAENESGRLVSRRTFSGETEGSSFSDIILKNASYGVMISSDFDVIPDDCELKVVKGQPSEAARNLIKRNLGDVYDVIASYDISLAEGGEEIQPDGEIEIGIPLDGEYENAIIQIVHTGEDGTVEVEETRRSGNMAYAKVSHLSQYSIAVPVLTEQETDYGWVKIAIAGAVLCVVILGGVLWYRSRRYYDDI